MDIPIDDSILDMYPEDGPLPGIEDIIITDHKSDTSKIFLEETVGITEHPAENLRDTNMKDSEPFVFLEKMGVSDPEGDKLTG